MPVIDNDRALTRCESKVEMKSGSILRNLIYDNPKVYSLGISLGANPAIARSILKKSKKIARAA
jgi:hypothetical protein